MLSIKSLTPCLLAASAMLLQTGCKTTCCSTTCESEQAQGLPAHQNPVWPGYLADPAVLKHGEWYYVYGTTFGTPDHPEILDVDLKGRHFVIVRSKDLANWEFVGGALEPAKGKENLGHWAPGVAEKDGKFYMYYSCPVGDTDDEQHRTRVAIADQPEGPFIDQGVLMLPNEGFTIDGAPFKDPKNGEWYLYFSKDFIDHHHPGTGNAVIRLSDDMVSTVGEPAIVTQPSAEWQVYEKNRDLYDRTFDAWHTVEGAFVVYKDDKYYSFYSGGNWRTNRYGLAYAVADHPMGPWTDMGTNNPAGVLKSTPDETVFGPGHNSAALAPDGKTWVCFYHAWDPKRVARQLCVDTIKWTDNGPHVTPTR